MEHSEWVIANLEEEEDNDVITSWPYNCIDWQHAARELMYDYMTHDDFYFHNY